MTNREIISSFRTLTDKSQLSDDSGWSTRMVFYHLLKYRSYLLSQKKRANRPLNSDNYQTICVSLEEVDLVECPSIPPSGKTWLRSKEIIPDTILGFQTIMSPSVSTRYEPINWQDIEDIANSRYDVVRKKPYYTEKVTGNGTYIYILNDDFIPNVQVTAMFYNPIEAQLFNSCDVNEELKGVSYLDLEFVLDPDLLSPMMDIALDRIYKYKSQVSDIDNDDLDSIRSNPNQVK